MFIKVYIFLCDGINYVSTFVPINIKEWQFLYILSYPYIRGGTTRRDAYYQQHNKYIFWRQLWIWPYKAGKLWRGSRNESSEGVESPEGAGASILLSIIPTNIGTAPRSEANSQYGLSWIIIIISINITASSEHSRDFL